MAFFRGHALAGAPLALSVSVAAALCGFQTMAFAQNQDLRDLKIGAQPLPSALLTFAEQSGLEIIFDAGVVRGKQTGGVSGEVSADAALQTLLADTGLRHRFTDPDTVTLIAEAPTDGDGPVRLDQITVTGERTERTIQETSSSVSVTTSEDLERIPGPKTVESLLVRTPNINATGASNVAPTIRGLDSTGVASAGSGFIGGARPRTTVQVDGRAQSLFEYTFGETPTWDVEQVEVFRGPQTTTQGRNSIAGAIFVRTKDPSYEYETEGQTVIGNFGTRQFSAVANAPILEDQVAVRLAFDFRDHRTFLNVNGLTQPTGADPTADNYRNVRGKVLFEPKKLPDLQAKLTYSYNDTTRPQTEFADAPFEERTRFNQNFSVFQTETHSFTMEANYFLSDALESRTTTSYLISEIQRRAPAGQGLVDADHRELAVESVLDYRDEELGLKGLVGVSGIFTHQDDAVDASALGLGVAELEDDITSTGVFGELTWTPIHWLDLTAGGRFQRDSQDRFGVNSGGAVRLFVDFEEVYYEFLPKAGAAFRLSDDLTVGATVQKGYNPGGFTVSFTTFQQDIFLEETVWNYEAYWRANLLNDRLAFNGNIFYSDFENQQLTSTVFIGANPVSFLDNAEDTRTYGLEADVQYFPSDELELYGGLGLLDTEIREFTSSSTGAVPGNELQRAPNVTLTAGINYEPLEGFLMGIEGLYVSEFFSDDANTERERINGYFVANAQLSYTYENLRAFASVTNIFDTDYELQTFAPSSGLLGDPREYVVGMHMKF